MIRSEAYDTLSKHLARFIHSDGLAALAESQQAKGFESFGADGTLFHGQVLFFWDNKAVGTVRIVGSIAAATGSDFLPVTQQLSLSVPSQINKKSPARWAVPVVAN